jgi:predicted PurR-regulated permease PerM
MPLHLFAHYGCAAIFKVVISVMVRASSLQRITYGLLISFSIVAGLYFAKPFLVPVCFAGLLAMLLLPLSSWFESQNITKGLAILICIVMLLAIIAGIVSLIGWQVSDLAEESSNIETKLQQMLDQLKEYVRSHFGISEKNQEKMVTNQASGAGGFLANLGSSLTGFVVDFILVMVYIFLFMYYRDRIKNFILQLITADQKKNASSVLHEIQKVSQKYLTGLGMMIVCLWIMYSIGFSIVGLKYALLFAILCGLLEIVPFIGNLTGNLLAVIMVVIQGGGFGMVIGILITYLVVQFLQTYLLEPLVVGAQVNINPLFTIIILVAGELVWGIPGLILSLPLLGIVKIICDHVEPLKPFGQLIGSPPKKKTGLFVKKN